MRLRFLQRQNGSQKVIGMTQLPGICIGAVIRGATPHFDFVASESAKGISQVSSNTGVPVIYGVITTDTVEQAIERTGTKMGNKGAEAAAAAIEMANLYKKLDQINP